MTPTAVPKVAKPFAKPAKPSRISLTLFRLLLLAASVAGTVALFELGGRFFLPGLSDNARYYERLEDSAVRSAPILEHTREGKDFDAKFGYVMRPNATRAVAERGLKYTWRTNSLGFRAREIEPRLPGEYRVMLVGDSFFYGMWIEDYETIAVHLEDLARSDPNVKRPVRVYNFAQPGLCTVQELIVAQTYAPCVQPDAILLGFFAANDVIANALTQVDGEGCFSPVPQHVDRFRHDLKAELGPLRHSLIFRLASLTGPFGTRLVYRIGGEPWILEQNYDVLRRFQNFCKDQKYQFELVFQHTTDSLSRGWRRSLFRLNVFTAPLMNSAIGPGYRILTDAANTSSVATGRNAISRMTGTIT